MYAENENWKPYYEEMDPEERKKLYEAIAGETEDDGAGAFRQELLQRRYADPKNPQRTVDNFLWNILILPGFLRPAFFIKPLAAREVKGVIRELLLEGAESFDEAKRSAAYWEYRNAARRYIATCHGPKYAKKVFGIMESNDEEKLTKTARDFIKMTVTIPKKFGLVREMEIFTDALKDEFLSTSPEAARAYRKASYEA
ncbi:MAG: hypothetical protein K6E30_04835 [Lachnospiraceae bacterium]|nr:hypothetical protein [Lachnospiraceae bacterium]